MKVLLIDSNWDIATNTCAILRRHLLKIDSLHNFEILSLLGEMATKVNVDEMNSDDIKYISGQGHGRHSMFTGDAGEAIWKKANINESDFKGKIIHLLSCLTAAELGSTIIKKGAMAFLGYEKKFWFMRKKPLETDPLKDSIATIFIDIALEIDRSLLSGGSVKQAHDNMMVRYDKMIDEIEASNQDAAARLLWNRRYFRSGVIHNRWGDKNARLPVDNVIKDYTMHSQPIRVNVSERDWNRPVAIDLDGNLVSIANLWEKARIGHIKKFENRNDTELRELAASRVESRPNDYIDYTLSITDEEDPTSIRAGIENTMDTVELEVGIADRITSRVLFNNRKPVKFDHNSLDRPVTFKNDGELIPLKEYKNKFQSGVALSLDALDENQIKKLVLTRLEYFNPEMIDITLTDGEEYVRTKSDLLREVTQETEEGEEIVRMERLYVAKLLKDVDEGRLIV